MYQFRGLTKHIYRKIVIGKYTSKYSNTAKKRLRHVYN